MLYRGPLPPEAHALLPTHVRGAGLTGRMRNGDFWLRTDTLDGPALRRAPTKPKGWLEHLLARLYLTASAPDLTFPLAGED